MNALKFIETQTVTQFCREKGVSRVDVKKNPKKNGALFMTFGSETGGVSSKGIPAKPMVSLVEKPDGSQFYLLHEEGAGAETVASFS